MRPIPLPRRSLLLALASTLVVAACASSGTTSDRTIDNARGLTTELGELKVALTQTLGALEAVRASTDTKGFLSKKEVVVGDLESAFKSYGKARSRLVSQDATVTRKKESLSKEFEAYLSTWEQNMAAVENKDLQEAAAKRRGEARKNFESVQKELQGMSERYNSLLGDLAGIETALKNDLTAEGVAAADGVIGGALKKGAGVQEDLDRVIAAFEGYTQKLAMRAAEQAPAPQK